MLGEEVAMSGASLSSHLQDSMPTLIDFEADVESVCDNPKSLVEERRSFAGKTIVITGAGGQFGREACIYFAMRGVRIAALDQDKLGLKKTFEAIQTEVGDTFDFKPYVCDVTNVEQINGVVKSIAQRFKQIDLLWNNAGYQGKIKPLLEYDPEDFQLVMNINVTGTFIFGWNASQVDAAF